MMDGPWSDPIRTLREGLLVLEQQEAETAEEASPITAPVWLIKVHTAQIEAIANYRAAIITLTSEA